MEWIGIASFIISIVSGPIVLAAVNAIHERKTASLIALALEKENKNMTAILEKENRSMQAEHERSATKMIEEALGKERERSKELFALKHEVAEMKGHVMQLVANTGALDTKLDKMSDLLMQLSRSR
jgi:pyruvoyl-dependent arginine decarboxylase (PvlArgDC)